MRSQNDWQESLLKLIEGNMRFRLGLRSVESYASSLKLREFAENGQFPSATILTCSDSRVPTEILFDKGIGDLFVIRVAGNVISSTAIASIEYAALVLQTPLCVVMGHTQCGAIRAAITSVLENSPAQTSNLESLLKKITPSVHEVLNEKGDLNESELVKNIISANVKRQVTKIKEKSEALRKLSVQDNFKIVGAIYNLHDGEVSFDLNEVPNFKFKAQVPLPSLGEYSFLNKGKLA